MNSGEKLVEGLGEKMPVISNYENATFLHPGFKNLTIATLGNAGKNRIIAKVESLLRGIDTEFGGKTYFIICIFRLEYRQREPPKFSQKGRFRPFFGLRNNLQSKLDRGKKFGKKFFFQKKSKTYFFATFFQLT